MSTPRNLNTQLWTMAWRNVKRRPRRSLLSMTAIGVAALTMSCLLALVAGVKVDMANTIKRYSTGDILVENSSMVRSTNSPLALALADASALAKTLKTQPGVTSVGPRVTTGASVFVDGDAQFFPVIGLDFGSDPLKLEDFLRAGGSLPQAGERQALISSGLAEKLKLKVGDTLTAVTQTLRGSSNGMTFTVTGIVHPTLGSFAAPWLFTSLTTVQRFTQLGDAVTSLLVTAQPGTDLTALANQLQSLVAVSHPEASAKTWNQTSTTFGLLDYATVIYAVMGLIFFGLASTVIINTMLMVVLERAKEIGMLSALGMDPRSLRNLFLAESTILSATGAVLGSALGCVISAVLGVTGLDFTQEMNSVVIADLPSIFRPVLEVWNPVLVIVLATIVALGFTLVPVARLKKMQIVDALRGEV
jgi:putative ABC transport system permease protein